MSDNDAYKDIFLAESAEFLQQITEGLLRLEGEPGSTDAIGAVFRGTHSLKGMAGAMRYERAADLAHGMESVVHKIQSGKLSIDHSLIDTMLKAVDLLREVIAEESSGGKTVDSSEMMAALEALASSDTASSRHRDEFDPPDDRRWRVSVDLEQDCRLKGVRAHLVIKKLSSVGRLVGTVPSARAIENEEFGSHFEVLLASSASEGEIRDTATSVAEVREVTLCEEALDPVAAARENRAHTVPAGRRSFISDAQTVRVPIERLDHLVDLAGELVVLRSRLEKVAAAADQDLKETVDQLQRISSDLQYEVMRARMVPVGTVFNRFPRLVRDLARQLGKQVRLEMDGLDIELDRTVLDAISDPLVHLIRNGVDHGVGDPDARRAAGKPEEGVIRVTVDRERDHVAITVEDDGRGIDVDQVWQRALQLGLVEEDSRAAMRDEEILNFVYSPGFSTATHATQVSGRGVGMDVVRARIEGLGGFISVKTGRAGTRFSVRLPQTLAIIHALIVRSGAQSIAVPLSSIEEVFSVGDLTIDTVDGRQVVVRDGRVVPVKRLASILDDDQSAEPAGATSNVLMVHAGDSVHALHVDSLEGRMEIVVKPLSGLLKDTEGFTGAAVTGEGRVLLVLDPRAVFAERGQV